MKKTLSIFCALMCITLHAQTRYVGGDISMLPQYEQHNSQYKDATGKKINDLLTWFVTDCGWNTFRVRIFVNPTSNDPSLCQDLAYVTALGQRIKAAGAYFMLDFHYSDSWVDAGHIQAPAAWKGSDDATMAQHVADYTRDVLTALNAANATPDFVQVGNEIMYGLCGIQVHPYDKAGDNWDGYLGLLQAGCNTVRELCPNAQIIIHTDRPCNKQYDFYYYNKLRTNNVDFDIIGLSYYPFWHADFTPTSSNTGEQTLAPLVSAINYLKIQFPEKRVHIVECAYNFQYWPSSGVNYNTQPVWPCSKTGQYNFVKDLVDALLPLDNVDGLSYWFPEEAGNGDDTDWSTSQGTALWTWQNRGFWDENQSSTGHAINRTGSITGDKTAADVCAPYYMGKFAATPESIDQTPNDQRPMTNKVLRNGQLLIERNGHTYTLTGAEVK
ncbi:MAG: glycosyl hydrolase 53 family protein [Paludibacteraceae bacterium]|nr:glycosyl hydrolase 53 family protein [Paludibacteraceae bacterium]